ncbi:MAG: thiamine-phosphate kinase [Actinomycetota bacterium]
MDQTEDQLLAAIGRVLSGQAPGVVVGMGDDAAIVEPGRHHGILTADMLVEGVHFLLETTSAHDLGHKAVAVNVSDVAAMGGSPRYGLASLVVSPDIEAAWVMELCGGMRRAADEYGMALVGGDTNRGDHAVISVTVYGEVARDRAVLRSGARPGDHLVVTGALGAAAGGLRLAQAEPDDVKEFLGAEWARFLVEALERPVARLGEGQTLAQSGATAMIDLSDGLTLDLSRLCRESGVGATIRVADVPVAAQLADLEASVGADPLDLALHGGEDYELLAALPAEEVESAERLLAERYGTGLTDIGEVTEGSLVADLPDGRQEPLEPRGWDHFAS